MSAPHIILASLPSLCQKLSKLVEIWRSSDEKNFDFFLRHSVQHKFTTHLLIYCTTHNKQLLIYCSSSIPHLYIQHNTFTYLLYSPHTQLLIYCSSSTPLLYIQHNTFTYLLYSPQWPHIQLLIYCSSYAPIYSTHVVDLAISCTFYTMKEGHWPLLRNFILYMSNMCKTISICSKKLLKQI